MLQRSGSSRVTRKLVDTQDLLSFESCRSSVVDYTEEVSLESPRKMQRGFVFGVLREDAGQGGDYA